MRTRLHVFVALPLLAVAPGCRAPCCPPPGAVEAAHPTPPPSPGALSISASPREARQVLIEMALYTVAEERFVGPLVGRFGDGVAPLVMDPTEARGWEMALQKEGGVLVIALPSVVARAGEEASLRVGEDGPDGSWQGFAARAVPRMDGERILLDLIVTYQLEAHDPGAAQRVSMRGARLASGQSMVLMSAGPAAGQRLVALVTATLVEEAPSVSGV